MKKNKRRMLSNSIELRSPWTVFRTEYGETGEEEGAAIVSALIAHCGQYEDRQLQIAWTVGFLVEGLIGPMGCFEKTLPKGPERRMLQAMLRAFIKCCKETNAQEAEQVQSAGQEEGEATS